MKKTRICELLGIEYPILQGGMVWIANGELAAAVSEAGGIGVISANAGMEDGGDIVNNLRWHLEIARKLTRKPIGVNVPIMNAQAEETIGLCIAEKVNLVVTSAGNPATYTSRLKEAGIKVLHLVASVKHAVGAEKRGVDGVIAEGYEAGGHNGLDELTTFVLVPQVVDAVKIPVIAAGGIYDARGAVAAFALGAEGIQMGTRFVATEECNAHKNFKQAIVNSMDTDTVITGRKTGITRILKGPVASKLLEMESKGATPDELLGYIGSGRSRKGQFFGDLNEGEAYCGAIAGAIKEVRKAGDIIREIAADYDRIKAGL